MNQESIVQVSIKDIVVDEAVRTRPISKVWINKFKELIGLGELKEPLLVCILKGIYYLVDGNHRLEAWKIATEGNGDIKIPARVVKCENYEQMVVEAFRANKKHGLPYQEKEREALFWKFTQEFKWPKKKAQAELGISDEHTAEWYEPEIVTIPVDKEATYPEEPTPEERASIVEETIIDERASEAETPTQHERAMLLEKTNEPERASDGESPSCGERAKMPKEPTQSEPISEDTAAIVFHVRRLIHLIPAGWQCPQNPEIKELIGALGDKLMEAYMEVCND